MTPTTEQLAAELEGMADEIAAEGYGDYTGPTLFRAAAARLRELQDKVEGLSADLVCAVDVAFRRGALTWAKANYPARYEQLMAASRVELADEGTRAAQLTETHSEP